MRITFAHTPDADDAYMYYAIACGRIELGDYTFKSVVKDIHSLNMDAGRGLWDVTAISFAAYPGVADKYQLLPCGASIGDGYGPILVCRDRDSIDDIKSKKIAIPGKTTTAYLVLLHYASGDSGLNVVEMNFSDIPGAVTKGECDAGLLIHEGQLTYKKLGLKLLVDLGKWWKEQHSLPLPLGGNVIRRELSEDVKKAVGRILRESIRYALNHTNEAIEYAKEHGRGLDQVMLQKFVQMYVNEKTLSLDGLSIEALKRLFSRSIGTEPLAQPEIKIDPINID